MRYAMDKLDITTNNLYINRIINVFESYIIGFDRFIDITRSNDAFVYVISGICTYKFNNDYELTAKEGDILYLSKDSEYTINLRTDEYKYILCNFEFNCSELRKSGLYISKNKHNTEILFRKLLHEYEKLTELSISNCMSVLYNIYSSIQYDTSIYMPNSIKSKIIDSKEYIDKNFQDPSLSIAMLAERLNISDVYFRKLFKNQYNILPSQYIKLVRLNNAKKLMTNHFLSLEECAVRSGFSSLQYFCRIFKKSTGTTPSQYRTKNNQP